MRIHGAKVDEHPAVAWVFAGPRGANARALLSGARSPPESGMGNQLHFRAHRAPSSSSSVSIPSSERANERATPGTAGKKVSPGLTFTSANGRQDRRSRGPEEAPDRVPPTGEDVLLLLLFALILEEISDIRGERADLDGKHCEHRDAYNVFLLPFLSLSLPAATTRPPPPRNSQ